MKIWPFITYEKERSSQEGDGCSFYSLTRDVRDIEFKDSIKNFMESIGKHDFVISIISDNIGKLYV